MTSLSQQQRQVSSLLHDELQCVTVSSLSTRMGVSRSQAASLLQEAIKDSDRQYQANYVTRQQEQAEEIPCTVFRLVAEPYQEIADGNKYLYSLAAVSKDSTESVATAHERDMAHYRDLVADNQLTTILSESAKFDMIAPHDSIRDDYKQSIQNAYSDQGEAMAVEHTTTSTAARGGPKKVTTAASFFNAKSTASNKKSVAAKVAKTISKPASKPPAIASTKSEEKENTLAENKASGGAKSSQKVGNVDDFVGDEESDDSEEDSVDAKLRSRGGGSGNLSDDSDPLGAKRGAKANKAALTIDDSDDESVAQDKKKAPKKRKDEPVVSGAMDAFATKKEASETAVGAAKHKRRRKKLVEKTTMDASGYLHTETLEVWEDIPSDEDEPKVVAPAASKNAAPKPAAAKKNTASMKQGSLMGFFKKK